ncbi:MAG: radical SAM protein [Candidatus Aenigmarchaeota archaeon]|nr:radical SAM protein [Candidatus Aenigmarchaeota archaeon]
MKLKLLFLPRYHCNPDTGKLDTGLAKFPPLGIAVLTSYLRENQIPTKQDDLDVKVTCHNEKAKNRERKVNLKLFMDEDRIKNLVKTGQEKKLETEGEKIIKLTKCKGFDIIGFSLNIVDNPSSIAIALVLGKILKSEYDAAVVVGGGFGKDIMNRLLEGKFIDYVIDGDPIYSIAEINMLKFCEMFEMGVEGEKIPGVVYKKNGELVFTRKQEEYSHEEKFMITKPDFDGLPLPLYTRTLRCNIDGETHESNINFLPYFFVRGCPNSCAFCTYGCDTWAAKEPEKVATEIEELSKKYRVKNFFFINTTINPTYEYACKLANEIIKKDLNIVWTDCATFCKMDRKLLRKLKQAGAARLVFGMETGSPKMLKFVKIPYFSPTQAEKILKETYKLKILSQIDVIIGFPYESEFDIDCTIRFIKKNGKYLTGGVNLNKFYLNGLMLRYPERYGIRRREQEKFQRNWSTEVFDEIHGLKWEDKVQQLSKFHEKVHLSLDPSASFVPNAHELFFIAKNPEIKKMFFGHKEPPRFEEVI